MPNQLDSNTSKVVLQKFLDGFTCSQVVSKTVNTQLLSGDGSINPRTGDRIFMKRPVQFRAKGTPDGDISALARNDLVVGNAFGEVQEYITVDVEYSDLERAIQLNQLHDMMMQAGSEMVADLEVKLGRFINSQLALQYGSAGTNISQWSDVSNAGSYLKALGVPDNGNRYAIMNPFAIQNLADTQAGLNSGDNQLVNTAWKKSQISRNFGGVTALTSNCLPTHTNGAHGGTITVAAAPTATYVSVKDTYIQSVSLTGFTASQVGAVRAGDVLEFTGTQFVNLKTRQRFVGPTGALQNFQAVVTADADADGAGTLTALITAPIFDTNEQYNNINAAIASADAVTVISGAADADVNPSLFYHENAVGLGTVKLEKLHAQESRLVTEGGFSIRMTMGSELLQNQNIVRFDMLPVFATFNPLFGGRFYGTP